MVNDREGVGGLSLYDHVALLLAVMTLLAPLGFAMLAQKPSENPNDKLP